MCGPALSRERTGASALRWQVGVGNTAGRYFHGIRPTRPVDAPGADGGGSVHVTSTAEAAPGAGTGTGTGTGEPSGEEQGASRAGGRGPPLSPTATASSAATAREEEEEEEEEADKQQEKRQEKLEEEERLVKKIWSIAQGDGSAPATPQPGPGPGSGPGPALPPQPPGHAPNAHPFVNGVPLPEQ
ncbi:Protein of unknown function, partial [Gryllus bimaculatus]